MTTARASGPAASSLTLPKIQLGKRMGICKHPGPPWAVEEVGHVEVFALFFQYSGKLLKAFKYRLSKI